MRYESSALVVAIPQIECSQEEDEDKAKVLVYYWFGLSLNF
jgi:hypothetical protein